MTSYLVPSVVCQVLGSLWNPSASILLSLKVSMWNLFLFLSMCEGPNIVSFYGLGKGTICWTTPGHNWVQLWGSQQQKTMRVTGPLGNRLCSSLRSHPRWQWGRCGIRCPPSLMGPWEPRTRLTLFTWDLGRSILVWYLYSRKTSNRGSQHLSS